MNKTKMLTINKTNYVIIIDLYAIRHLIDILIIMLMVCDGITAVLMVYDILFIDYVC